LPDLDPIRECLNQCGWFLPGAGTKPAP
jgi:hypothetical protein